MKAFTNSRAFLADRGIFFLYEDVIGIFFADLSVHSEIINIMLEVRLPHKVLLPYRKDPSNPSGVSYRIKKSQSYHQVWIIYIVGIFCLSCRRSLSLSSLGSKVDSSYR